MSCVLMLQRGHSGDGCVLASTLCKYDFRNGDLFVLSWARVRRVRRGSLSSELLMCGGGVRSILLLPDTSYSDISTNHSQRGDVLLHEKLPKIYQFSRKTKHIDQSHYLRHFQKSLNDWC